MLSVAANFEDGTERVLNKWKAKSMNNKKLPEAQNEKLPLLEDAWDRPKSMTLPPPSSSPYTENGERKKGRIILPPDARRLNSRSPINANEGLLLAMTPPTVQVENTETKSCPSCTIL